MQFDRVTLPQESAALRKEVRAFLTEEAAHIPQPNSDFSTGHDPEFSAKLGARGWIGMTWPDTYGGGAKSFFDRYVVTEELLATGAPVSAHWMVGCDSCARAPRPVCRRTGLSAVNSSGSRLQPPRLATRLLQALLTI